MRGAGWAPVLVEFGDAEVYAHVFHVFRGEGGGSRAAFHDKGLVERGGGMKRAIGWLQGALLAALVPQCATAAEFIGLGHLPGHDSSSGVVAISADGSVVVGNSYGQGTEVFRWTRAGGMVGLGAEGSASDASGDGSVIVGGTPYPGFRWTSAGGMGPLPSSTLGQVLPSKLNHDGSVIVGRLNGVETARWTQATGWVGLGGISSTGGPYDFPHAVSDDGSVIVGEALKDLSVRAFRWTPAGGMQDLGVPPGADYVAARGISNDGNVVGGGLRNTGGNEVPFKWTEAGGFVRLAIFGEPAHNHSVLDANVDGSILAGASGGEAVIWDGGGIHTVESILIAQGIDLTGWSLGSAIISADGTTVAGSGFQNGKIEAWVAVIVPEPSALAVLVVGLAPLLGRTRARRL